MSANGLASHPLAARFAFIRALGAGGGGEVWLARDEERGTLVAIKALAPEVAGDEAALASFERLMAGVAALDDSNILRSDDLLVDDGRAWLVMEYAEGGDLTAWRGRPCAAVLGIVLPIARALGRLHRAGIVHRDVKTSNVLLMADGTPRLGDFGAAAWASEPVGRTVAPGSRYTMSPESLDCAPAAPAADVYGFGAMLYELLSGYPPFYPNVTPARIRGEIPGWIVAQMAIPTSVQELIAWCLRKSPAERPSSMAVIESRLTSALAELRAFPSGGDARLEQSMSNKSNAEAPDRSPSAASAGAQERPPDRSPSAASAGAQERPPDRSPSAASAGAQERPPDTSSSAASAGAQERPVIRPPAMPAEPLRGEWRRTTVRPPDPAEYHKRGFRRGLSVAGIALGALAIFIVFFALPKWVETPPTAPPRPVAAKVETPAAAPQKEAVDFAALARAKQQADEAREPLFERLERLRERAAEQWAADDFQKATAELAAADDQYAQREYLIAVQHFERLEPLLDTLESRASAVLKEQLAAGAQALAAGRADDAKAAFDLALKLEPKNAAATRGLARAGTLDQVLALLASAARAEEEGNSTAALADYRKALDLDKETQQASEGIARVSARVAGDAFASAMARGFAALGTNDYAAARSAFEAAGKIRPNAPEIADALKQVEQSERTRTIVGQLEVARAAESREQWAEALAAYQGILGLDSTVAAAKDGITRVQPRAELNQQLEIYLTQPERLFSSPVRAAARQTLERAGAIANPGPVLTQQVAKLREWLARADVPVQVALQSDNLTQVTVYRIGALGAFEQRSLELEPGEYTVLGTRPGYRDVRRQIMVMPGTPMPPVVIRCEDKI